MSHYFFRLKVSTVLSLPTSRVGLVKKKQSFVRGEVLFFKVETTSSRKNRHDQIFFSEWSSSRSLSETFQTRVKSSSSQTFLRTNSSVEEVYKLVRFYSRRNFRNELRKTFTGCLRENFRNFSNFFHETSTDRVRKLSKLLKTFELFPRNTVVGDQVQLSKVLKLLSRSLRKLSELFPTKLSKLLRWINIPYENFS